MRSSKSRSRNKNNRNRSVGNVVNRVFDSSGPEGKVRGTPQQIIDKYNQLARDAQLANDRVATENFQQHAEHYLRLLSEAQREQEQRREQQERENRERQAQRDRERNDRQDRDQTDGASDGRSDAQQGRRVDPGYADQPDILDLDGSDEGTGLVDTPESRADTGTGGDGASDDKPARKPRAPRKPRKKPEDKPQASSGDEAPSAAE